VSQRRSRGSTVEDWRPDPWDSPSSLYVFESERARKRRKWPKFVGFGLLAILVVMILVIGAVGWWLVHQLDPPGTPGKPVNFTVNAGETIDSLALRLEKQGFITNASVFEWYAKRQSDIVLTPGYYQLKPKDSMSNIIDILKTPPAQTFTKVLFQEGFTEAQMAARLQKEVPRLSAANFLKVAASGQIRSQFEPEGVNSLEGLLFPDTYQIAGNEDETSVVRRMVALMDRVSLKEGLDLAPQKVGYSPYQVLIVASMIEREAKTDSDRALIARVIYNRLAAKMPLQIDSTLYYLQDPNLPFDTLKSLNSPYNTYKVLGLPPTPIANPGKKSIDAALNPAPNPDPSQCPNKKPCGWLYYVLINKTTGQHAFATNLADHNANVAKAKANGAIP
jgi:UPF0755 protein